LINGKIIGSADKQKIEREIALKKIDDRTRKYIKSKYENINPNDLYDLL
jgi:hypothetical protein